MVRYFRCPSTVPVSVLKQLVANKYNVPEALRIELLYGDNRLLDTWTLMEIAYIFTWTRVRCLPKRLNMFILQLRGFRRSEALLNHIGFIFIAIAASKKASSTEICPICE